MFRRTSRSTDVVEDTLKCYRAVQAKTQLFSSLFLFRGLREDGRGAQKVAKLTVFSRHSPLRLWNWDLFFCFSGKLLKCRQVKLSFLNLTLPPERYSGLCNKRRDKKSPINDDEWRVSFNKPLISSFQIFSFAIHIQVRLFLTAPEFETSIHYSQDFRS